jgi:uncharacterized Zn-binding protein involved in type VI secretion
MAGEIIRQGDPTDHGGTVLEGSLTDICHGKPISYMGHMVQCPKCKGSFPIIEGVLTTTFYGKGVAVAGMKTACGATLIATQFTDIVDTGGGSRASANVAKSAVAVSAVRAAASSMKNEGKKKINAISWSYGPNETPVSEVSRFYVDLNLHVQTENYAPGELVDIEIEDDAGADVLEGVKKFTLSAKVGADGSAKLMNAFAGKTLITVPEATA